MTSSYNTALAVVNITNIILVITVLALISYAFYRKPIPSPRKLPLPPGPKPWPIIGNALDIPRTSQYLTFMKWADHYGASIIVQHNLLKIYFCDILGYIVHVDMFGQPIIILNTMKSALDLLQDRSSNYSDRLVTPMMSL